MMRTKRALRAQVTALESERDELQLLLLKTTTPLLVPPEELREVVSEEIAGQMAGLLDSLKRL